VWGAKRLSPRCGQVGHGRSLARSSFRVSFRSSHRSLLLPPYPPHTRTTVRFAFRRSLLLSQPTMSDTKATGSCSDIGIMAPLPTPGGRPMGLLDLPDDALSLIAEHVWASRGNARGLVGACRRTRRIGLAALPSLVIRWCPVCSLFGCITPPPTPAGRAPPLHPRGLDARLPSLIEFLALATGVRSVTLVDRSFVPSAAAAAAAVVAAATPVPPCACPVAVRKGVWRLIGAALGGRPLHTLKACDAVATSFLGGLSSCLGGGGDGGGRLRVLKLGVTSPPMVNEAAMALHSVAPTLTELTMDCLPGVPLFLAHLFRSAGRLPALRSLRLRAKHEDPPGGTLGRDEAAMIAEVCGGLAILETSYPLGSGFGPPWAVARGALPHLHTLRLQLAEGWSSAMNLVTDYAAVLRNRPMTEVRLSHTGGFPAPLLTALRSVDQLPKVLRLGAELEAADAEWLLGDPAAVMAIESLSLRLRCRPHLVLPDVAMPPRLRRLHLSCFTLGAADTPVCPSARWDVPPTLRRLSVSHDHGLRAADGDESADLPLVRWLLAAVVASRGGCHLKRLYMCARVRPGPDLDAALAPFVAAAAGTLCKLQLFVQPAGEDGMEQRRQMAAALSAALPGASIAVKSSVDDM